MTNIIHSSGYAYVSHCRRLKSLLFHCVRRINNVVTLLLFACIAYISSNADAQQEPDITLETYEIVGRDTRVFTIIGDRQSTVDFSIVPIIQPRKERKRDMSPGLMTEDERIVREELFDSGQGLYGTAEFETGFRMPAHLWGRGSASAENAGLTLGLANRTARLNTPQNLAPNVQDINASGYVEASGARFAAEVLYNRQGDEVEDKLYRGRDRSADRLGGRFTMRAPLFDTWDISGGFSVRSSTYEDSDLNVEADENVLSGGAKIRGDIGDMTLDIDGSGARTELDDDYGTVFKAGGTGTLLMADRLSMKLGASFAASEMPGDDTNVNLYPHVEAEWLITKSLALNLAYSPRLIEHSFGGLYNTNGLVTYSVPLIFEHRKLDASGRLLFRPVPDFETGIEAYIRKSENAPVFSHTTPVIAPGADYFEIVGGADVDVTGYRFLFSYDWGEYWGIDGEAELRDATWNYSGDVPYIPDMTGTLTGYYALQRFLTLYGSVNYFGEHYVLQGSTAKEDGFLTVDLGAELTFWSESLGLFVEARNITNSEGAWWTNPYGIPGIGLYAGIRGTY